ncbi:right-handed parallel beta-helix repeat-containing protein [Micromonospora sp. DSM 115977]|uniref:Right-handed parallel beta-helix repeat-containing protein n=1 Tax=Micromonospora reichwaldensis TaxID=3075516 RepID=A0ABU2WZY1_9ACTN|nr:right-handed parallel beta-helix repeat-containing protein [Micromonospora sp. DSM 115977]MDT0531477.1 right-handed parallel beta-helix repeat-containing protein [Micromonospora sp. DSM 115977]
MHHSDTRRRRHRRGFLTAIGAALLAVALTVGMAATAHADTLFSDDFSDGNSSGWTASGGSWSVTGDSARALRQGGTSSDARSLAGTSSWTDYSVQATVRPTAFNGSNRFVALLARVQSSTSYYYLALRSNNTVELKRLSGGSATTLDTAALSVDTGTTYTVRLDVAGGSLKGYVNGALLAEATDTSYANGRIGVATFYASADFDDVRVDSGGAGPTPTPTNPTPSPTGDPGNPGSNVADGWASVDAWGQNGTTGGAGGPTVTVTTASQFVTEAASSGPKVIQVSGMIALPGPMHEVTSDKTIVGVGANSGFTGGGLNIGLPIDNAVTAPPANAVHNVIIRNLNFRNWADDAINVQMFTHHVWIDHNTWTTGADGGVDIKRGSSYVTVSYNHADGTDKNMLLGHDDGNAAQDTGRLKVTYHHNFFDNTNQRNPRVRFGDQVHVFNNYYLNTGNYGVASTEDAGVIVEGNHFENVDDPYHLAEGSSGDGRLVARNNCLVNSGAGQTGGSVTNPPYAYTVGPACDTKAVVTAQAGVGRVGLPGGPTPPPATTPPPTGTPTPTPTTPPAGDLIGWATQNGGTTGGAGGQTVTVSDGQALADALESSAPLVIRVQGALTMPDKMNDVRSNKTVLGVGNATLDNGLNISGASNVIVRNLTFRGWDDDAINVQGSRNVWIDHNTFDGGYDGAVDVKRASDFVTVSWNRVTNHTKSMLLGHDDGHTADIGHLRVTYHHNWFDGSRERHPRVRFGDPVHVFNNYYFGADYGVASTMGAGVLVEGNHFENVTRPTAVGYAESGPGDLVQRNNIFTNSGAPESAGDVAAIPYPYRLDDASGVKAAVTAGAGAGRINP